MDENSHPSQENELIEEDIPGCQLNLSELASYRVEQLKFWLSCRGDSLKNLPTKAACIQRINNYVKNGLKDKITDPTPLNIYSKTKSLKRDHNPETSHDNLVSSPSSDAQYMKGNYWMTNSKQLQWSKSLQHAPIFTIKELEEFFSSSGKTGKTQKRAENLLFDNFLDSVECGHDIEYFYIRAVCSASYTKSQFHKLSCCLSIKTAQVIYAYCTCKAGKGGFCNHVYGLLKLLAQFVLDKSDSIPLQLPCTSRPCGWTVPKVRKMNVQKPTVMEAVIKKPKLGRNRSGIQCNLYEARSVEQQNLNFDDLNEMKENLSHLDPNIPIINVIRNTISDSEWTDTKFGKVPIFSPLAYQCSKFGNNFNVYLNIDNLISLSSTHSTDYPLFPHKVLPQYYPIDESDLTLQEQTLLKKLELLNGDAVILEEATRQQSAVPLWFDQRKQRVTASAIYDVAQWKRGFDNHAHKFVSGSIDEIGPFLQRKLDHGKMYEAVALQKYHTCMQDYNNNVHIYPCGLVVNENNCWLGCTPDGKVVFGDLFGIAECKCPEQYKNSDIFDVAGDQSNNFMLYVQDGRLCMKKTHRYYYQIQCQLALTGAAFCDLIVYTFKSIAIVRILFDQDFWTDVVHVVGQRYFQHILPKLAESQF